MSVNVILILTYIHLFKSAVRVKVQMWTCIKLILMYAPSKFNAIPLLRGWDQNEYAVNIVNIANEIQIFASNYRLNILNMEWISVMLKGVPELARYPKKKSLNILNIRRFKYIEYGVNNVNNSKYPYFKFDLPPRVKPNIVLR